MKVAVIADSHWDEHRRFEECQRLHAWIREDAERRGVKLTLHAGDVFERKSTPRERAAAFSWFQAMADLGAVVVVRGNHDAVEDLPLLTKLDSAFPITVVETAAVVEVDEALVACVAWPRKSALLAATGADSHEGGEALVAEALRNVLRGLGDDMRDHDGPTMLLMHAMVRDSVTSTGQPLVGCDMEVGLDDLALVGAGAYFLGHIHMMQRWLIGGAPCVYPGAPRRTAFGEVEAKGYIVAEWDGPRLVSCDFIEAPATPMVHLEAIWNEAEDQLVGSWRFEQLNSTRGAEVRIRYTTPSDRREASRKQSERWRNELLADGALLVKLEEVVKLEQRTRADAIPAQATLIEKLEAYWRSKRFEPGTRREALLAKLRQIEEVTRVA